MELGVLIADMTIRHNVNGAIRGVIPTGQL